MTDRMTGGVVGFMIGAAVGGAITYGVTRYSDEDRPPIIVKGGSLIFETSKNWKKKQGNEWQPDHPNGKPTSTLQVMFIGGSGSCGPVFASDVSISYRLADQSTVRFTVTIQPDATNNRKTPTITGPDLAASGAGAAYKLTYDKPGEITEVTAGSSTCASPAGAVVRPVK